MVIPAVSGSRTWMIFGLHRLLCKSFTREIRGEVENSKFSENSQTWENIFPRFLHSNFSIMHYSPNRNQEMKTSEFSLRHFDKILRTPSWKPRSFLEGILIKLQSFPTPSFLCCTLLKTENPEMKASEFSLRHFDQNVRFSNPEFSILVLYSKPKLGVFSKALIKLQGSE